MSICPRCRINHALAIEKGKVVEVAEKLVDVAGPDAAIEEIVEAAATLKIAVDDYRKIAKRLEPKEGEDAVQ